MGTKDDSIIELIMMEPKSRSEEIREHIEDYLVGIYKLYKDTNIFSTSMITQSILNYLKEAGLKFDNGEDII